MHKELFSAAMEYHYGISLIGPVISL